MLPKSKTEAVKSEETKKEESAEPSADREKIIEFLREIGHERCDQVFRKMAMIFDSSESVAGRSTQASKEAHEQAIGAVLVIATKHSLSAKILEQFDRQVNEPDVPSQLPKQELESTGKKKRKRRKGRAPKVQDLIQDTEDTGQDWVDFDPMDMEDHELDNLFEGRKDHRNFITYVGPQDRRKEMKVSVNCKFKPWNSKVAAPDSMDHFMKTTD